MFKTLGYGTYKKNSGLYGKPFRKPIEYQDTAKEIKTISVAPPFGSQPANWLKKGKSGATDKAQLSLLAYYRQISDALENYPYVLLFGPTNAKTELQALLAHDKRFANAQITMKITEKLDHHQQLDFINNFFYID